MYKIMFVVGFAIFQFFLALIIFSIVGYVGKFLIGKVKSSSKIRSSKLFNLKEYLPEEQISELHQIRYLLMIVIFAFNILYLLFFWNDNTDVYIVFDIIVSAYLVININQKSIKDKILLFMLIPFNSINMAIFEMSTIFIFNFLHVFAFLYFIKVYYGRFKEYSDNNSLGITIMLMFFIVFISFLFTILVENATPLDSFNMVSNAFTSNGYTILGKSDLGKINAIVLVWSGFILSGAGTATVASALVMKHINNKFDELEQIVKKKK